MSERIRSRSSATAPVWALSALVAVLPFLYGAVHAPARAIYVVAATGLLLWHLKARAGAGQPVAPDHWAVLFAVAALVWAGLALVPLPESLLQRVAPATWTLAIEGPRAAGLSPGGWHPIAVSLAPAAEAWSTAAAHLAIFVVAIAACSGRRGARTLAATLAIAGALIAVLAIAQQLAGASRIYFIGLARPQFYGTLVNGNHTAGLLAVCALCGLGLLARERDLGKKALWGVCAVTGMVAAMNSLSRGGILALALGLGAFVLGTVATQVASRRRSGDEIGRFFRRNLVVVMLLALAVFYLSWLAPRNIGRELSTLAALDLPTDYRALVWKDSAGIVADWPATGSGPGTFAEVFPAYRTFVTGVRTEMAESEYVQAIAEGGPIGLLLMLGFAGFVLVPFFLRFFADPFRYSGVHLGFASALLAVAAHAFVDFPLRVPAIAAIVAALAGALVGATLRRAHVPGPGVSGTATAGRREIPGPGGGPMKRGLAKLRRPVRKAGRPASRWRLLAWLCLPPLAWWGLAVALRAPERSGMPGSFEAAAESLLHHPGEARAWLRAGRLAESTPDADPATLYRMAMRRAPADPDVHRLAASGFVRIGEARLAADALAKRLALYDRAGEGQPEALAILRLDLAQQLVWAGDLDRAQVVLDAAGEAAGVRGLVLRADLLAARESGAEGSLPAIDAYLAAAAQANGPPEEALRTRANRRALLLAANAARDMEPEKARALFDRLIAGWDPGALLVELSGLVARGSLDGKRIWGGTPWITLDAFDEGEPRLSRASQTTPGELVSHTVAAVGRSGAAEALELRYPGAGTVRDLWTAPLSLRSSEPRLALRLHVRGPARPGDQACAIVNGSRIFGRLDVDAPHSGPSKGTSPESSPPSGLSGGTPPNPRGPSRGSDWHSITVEGLVPAAASRQGVEEGVSEGAVRESSRTVSIEGWCFDTRGGPGPWRIDDLQLTLAGKE